MHNGWHRIRLSAAQTAVRYLWLVVCLVSELCLAQPTKQFGWDNRFGLPGANGYVSAMAFYNGQLYVAGAFSFIDGVPLNNIARWDGAHWSPVGGGLNGGVGPMVVGADGLYVGGSFTQAGQVTAGGIARWDGTRWSPVGNGVGIRYVPNTTVKGIAVDGSNVYIGGDFRAVDDVEVPFVAKWDGQRWSPVGRAEDISPNGVTDLAWAGGALYGAGDFYAPSRQSFIYVARLAGDRWTSLGSGVDYYVWKLAAKGNTLYARGDFSSAGGLSANGFAVWDGAQWSVFPQQQNSGYRVSAIGFSGDDLLVGELQQTDPFTVTASRISLWDGANWTPLVETGGGVGVLARFGNEIVCSGGFQFNGGVRTGNLARWNGVRWSGFAEGNFQGVYGSVSSVAVSERDVFVSGSFQQADDAAASYIARWDGSRWFGLGSGLNGGVSAMAVSGENLYVIGGFTSAGGVAATNVARWDGAKWSAMGPGLQGGLTAISVGGREVYVARKADIVKWDGRSWRLEAGFGSSYITAMAHKGNDLFVGGDFGRVGGVSANNVARWDGRRWHALDQGVSGEEYFEPNFFTTTYVSQLAVHGNDLYVAGSFTKAGAVPAANIARWDGRKWSALGNGLGGQGYFFSFAPGPYSPVRALAVKDGEVYAGGQFVEYYGAPANFVARWDGERWSALGDSVNAQVLALAVSGNSVFVGGEFSFAAGHPSYGFGIWHKPPPRHFGNKFLRTAGRPQP